MLLFISLLCMSSSHALFTNQHGLRQVAFRLSNKHPQPGKLRYIVDIDGTICSKTNSDYPKSKPYFENIDVFNQLYSKGHEIHYWTARGALSGKNWDDFTVRQLESWGVQYNTINMGKPHYDVWVDDKAINAFLFCEESY